MTNPIAPTSLLRGLGHEIIDAIENGRFPIFELQDRRTGNIVFDSKSQEFVLGTSQVKRDSSNIRHVRSFAQLVWAASFARKLLLANRTSSLRDLYYSSEAFGVDFSDQAESDRIIGDLECLTGLAREELGIFPEERSTVYGRAVMRYTVSGYEGKTVDLTISPDGLPIGPALMTADPLESDAEIILAVESGGMFSRLIETKAWERFNALLIQLGGQAPRATRRLMYKFHKELDLPVYVFTDGDPWGMHIARVIMSGSANSAHIRKLTIPDAKWMGVTPEDIANHTLPTEPMSNVDLKRLDELSRDVRYTGKEWQNHIKEFKQIRVKAEQQAFSKFGMDYVVDTYLPEKLA